MSKERIEQQFSEDMDRYIRGGADIGENDEMTSEEYKDLLETGKELSQIEDCDEMCSQRLRERFMMQLEAERENGEMKKVKSIKKTVTVAISVAAIGVVMAQTTFGQNLVSSIIGSFTTGRVTILQLDKEAEEAERQAIIEKHKNEPMPEEYKGKIFDKDGNEFTYFPAYLEGAYNAKGEPLMCVRDGEVYTEEEWNKISAEEEEYTEIKDSSKLNEYTNFTVSMPSYLPEGVKFESAGVYSAEDVRDNPCIEIIFTNEAGEEAIYLQERLNCEEAKCEGGTYNEIKEVDINGAKGLIHGNSLDWETDETIYLMDAMDESISPEEMVEVAKSIK